MLLQIHISRSTVSVSTSRGTPPSTLSVKGQIETVRVKGTVENSACLQWLESDSVVVVFIMNSGSLQRKLLWPFEKQKAVNVAKCLCNIYTCLVCFTPRVEIGFPVELLKNRCFKVCVLVGWIFIWLIIVLIVTVSFSFFLFHRHRKLNL